MKVTAEQIKALRAVLATLPPREEKIVRMRFGIGRDGPMEEADIAQALGISEVHVGAALQNALARIQDRGAKVLDGRKP